jgi:preprotein translocase subunit YajC
MSLDTGDRVIATSGIGGIIFSKVPKGTRGTVVKVRGMGSSYTVAFDNGVEEDYVRDSEIAKINR